jgi:hypothetical protein
MIFIKSCKKERIREVLEPPECGLEGAGTLPSDENGFRGTGVAEVQEVKVTFFALVRTKFPAAGDVMN